VHGRKVDLHLERLWSQNISITTKLVDTVTIHILLKAVASHQLEPSVLITHRFGFDKIMEVIRDPSLDRRKAEFPGLGHLCQRGLNQGPEGADFGLTT